MEPPQRGFGGQHVPTPYLWKGGSGSMNWCARVLIMALQGPSCRASSAAVELITPASRRARAGPSEEIRTGRAVQITLNQKHLWTVCASSRIPILQREKKNSSPRTDAHFLDAVIIAIASLDIHSWAWSCTACFLMRRKKGAQLRSGGVVSLFHYLFNTACIMSII